MKYFLACLLTMLAVGTSYGQQTQSDIKGAGVLNLGAKDKDPAVSDSSDKIKVAGNFVASGTSVADGGLGLSLWSNSYLSATLGQRNVAAIGGVGMRTRGRSTDTVPAMHFYANQAGDTTTTVADLVGSYDQNGGWTFGILNGSPANNRIHGYLSMGASSNSANAIDSVFLGSTGSCATVGCDVTLDLTVPGLTTSFVGGTVNVSGNAFNGAQPIGATFSLRGRKDLSPVCVTIGTNTITLLNSITCTWVAPHTLRIVADGNTNNSMALIVMTQLLILQ